MNHYYDNNTNLKSEIKNLVYYYKEKKYEYLSDNGVFSKNAIDYGSRALNNNFIKHGKTMLEVGCGYGPIGITLGKYYNLDVTMIDVNDRAIELCKKNAEKNKLNCRVIKSNVYDKIDKKYDVIISNPPIRAGKSVVFAILDCYDYLNEDGELWIVIQKKQGADSAMKKIDSIFGNHTIVKRDKGYYVIMCKKVLLT